MRDHLSRLMLSAGLGSALFVAFAYIFTALFMIAGGSIGAVPAILLLLLSFAAGLGVTLRMDNQPIWPVAGGMALLLCLPALLAGMIIDTSIDGQAYHYQAVESLTLGWNPFYEKAPYIPGANAEGSSVWVQHYPIASWTVMALEKAAGIPLENTKGFAITLMMSAGLITASFLLRAGMGLLTALSTAVIATANPVVIAQIFTRMNDGVLASCLLIIIALAAGAICLRQRYALLALAPVMIFAVNLKFSVIPVMVLICGFICLAMFARQGWQATYRAGLILAVAGIVGIFGIGFAPYGNNLLHFGHPFYPLMGASETRDILTGNKPEIIEGMNHFQAFFFSLFSETHSGYGAVPSMKLPFMLSAAEIRAAGGMDTRIAGFGPLFSGIFLVSLGMAIFAGLQKARNRLTTGALYVAATLLFLTLIFPENWWARYVPYFWLVPIATAIACFQLPGQKIRWAAFALLGLMTINAGLVFLSSTYLNVTRSNAAMQQVYELDASADRLVVDFDLAMARADLFHRAGIEFATVRDLNQTDCVSVEQIAGYGPDREGGTICHLPVGGE